MKVRGVKSKITGDRTVWVGLTDDEAYILFDRPAEDEDPEQGVTDGRFITRVKISHDALEALIYAAADAINNHYA